METYEKIVDKVEAHFRAKLPFVLFSFPNQTTFKTLLQNNIQSDILKESKNGFIFKPFDDAQPSFFISEELSEIYSGEIETAETEHFGTEFSENEEDHARHLDLVEKTISKIRSTKISKIVISRRKEFAVEKFDLNTLISRLLNLYPNAFRYIWYHPETGIWCGATPEILLEVTNGIFKTMALAGTRKVNDRAKLQWTEKELEEQQFVTDSILENLDKITTYLKVSKTRTHRAGDLEHLRTDIEGAIRKNGKGFMDIAKALHPTPAVCGRPRALAMEFIKTNENYNREYYTGFLGLVSQTHNNCNLFVNLRCMKLEEKSATLYAGGGITTGSISESEWTETHNKLHTMAKVLEPLL